MTLKSSQITPKAEYFSRRRFLGASAGALALGAFSALGREIQPAESGRPAT